MADKMRFILSGRVGKSGINEGKSEIVIKVYLTRTIRVQIKSGVFIIPKHFGGSEVGVVVPKQGKLNFAERDVATAAKRQLEDMVRRITTLMRVIEHQDDSLMTREYFLDTLALLDRHQIPTDEITAATIEDLYDEDDVLGDDEDCSAEADREETFLELVETFLSNKSATENYRKHFYVYVRAMVRYERFCQLSGGKRRNFRWNVKMTTNKDIEDFIKYIREEDQLVEKYPKIFKKIFKEQLTIGDAKNTKTKIEGRGSNTIIKFEKNIKQLFTWAYDTGRTTCQPFKGIAIGSEHYGLPFYLSTEERNQIADYDFSCNTHLETQRDIFIFQCLVGCRFGDLVKLTPANIRNGVLEYVPRKTKDDYQPVKPRVPLNSRAMALIEKYKGKDIEGRLFPFISNQKYNDAIKEIFTTVGITRIVQVRNAKTGEIEPRPLNEVAASHMARRTFVGAAYKVVKDPNLIGKMSGHVEGSKAFNRYRNIDDDDLRNITDMMN